MIPLAGLAVAAHDEALFSTALKGEVQGVDKHGDPRNLGGFSFQVNYDETKVCVELRPGPLAQAWIAAGGACIINDIKTTPTLQGNATIACNNLGKEDLSPPISDNLTLASIVVKPMPDWYSLMKPNNGNGNIVLLLNKGCKLTDRQGSPSAPPAGFATCTGITVTIRYLEGDVVPDCRVDTTDTQTVAFRWGSPKGTLLYGEFFNLEPSKPKHTARMVVALMTALSGRHSA